MDTGAAIDLLLDSACPSTRSRTRLELLGQQPTDPAIRAVQARILEDGAVRRVLGWRRPDGWLGYDFNGRQSLETGIRLLCEKGVDPGHPIVVDALLALERHPDRMDRGLGTVGAVLDARGFGGARTIRAALFAATGREDRPFVTDEIGEALRAFEAVLSVQAIAELVESDRGRVVYRSGRRWPSIYHLRLLASTRGWRSAAAREMVTQAVSRLCRLAPIPHALVRDGSRFVAPASFAMDDFTSRLDALSPAGWMAWFHRMELLSRLGVVHQVAELDDQVRQLRAMVDAAGGMFEPANGASVLQELGCVTPA